MASAETRLAAGIDIGGTKIALGLATGGGVILSRQTFATPRDFDEAVSRMDSAIRELARTRSVALPELAGIGIGCAGPVDPQAGTVNNPYTLPGWEGKNLVVSLRDALGIPVFMENDADAALLGEFLVGAARGFDPVVMLTFGTGIGGAALVRGEIFRGARGEHPEIGHLPVRPDGPPCYCGRGGCLESIASGAAIEKAAERHGIPSARDVFKRAAAGDAKAKSMVSDALDATACAAWALLHSFLPQRFVLGGGIMDDHFDLFAASIQQSIDAATMIPSREITVAKAMLGNDAGLVGGAALAFRGGQAHAS